MRSFKLLHDFLQSFDDINDVDTVAYLEPFLDVIRSHDTRCGMGGGGGARAALRRIHLYICQRARAARAERLRCRSGPITGAALSSVNKFLLYGLITKVPLAPLGASIRPRASALRARIRHARARR